MAMQDEVDQKLMSIEAEAAVREVAFAVNSVAVSKKYVVSGQLGYLNVETKEGQRLFIELTAQGFRIVGKEFDVIQDGIAESNTYYETIYSLLDAVSPQYRKSFGDALIDKLNHLQQSREDD